MSLCCIIQFENGDEKITELKGAYRKIDGSDATWYFTGHHSFEHVPNRDTSLIKSITIYQNGICIYSKIAS